VTLLVDIGNTRVKWAACEAGTLEPQRAACHAGWSVEDWQRALFDGRTPDRVVVATVAGAQSKQMLETAAAGSGVRDVEFVRTTAAAAGVRNAYRDPRLLGVDRWVAVIGAYSLHRGACCVVDVGTAATVDAVDATGQHLGGFIVPGPQLMVSSLHGGTSDLAAHTAASTGEAVQLLADNTRDAIERGCRVAVASLADRVHGELVRGGASDAILFVTGGAAAEVMPYVISEARSVPDLVLQGLAAMLHRGS
jgi:type III pantothenate kinase